MAILDYGWLSNYRAPLGKHAGLSSLVGTTAFDSSLERTKMTVEREARLSAVQSGSCQAVQLQSQLHGSQVKHRPAFRKADQE